MLARKCYKYMSLTNQVCAACDRTIRFEMYECYDYVAACEIIHPGCSVFACCLQWTVGLAAGHLDGRTAGWAAASLNSQIVGQLAQHLCSWAVSQPDEQLYSKPASWTAMECLPECWTFGNGNPAGLKIFVLTSFVYAKVHIPGLGTGQYSVCC